MHTLLIHQAFASPDSAGGTRHFELASRAAAQGHRFTVVASDVSYLTGRRSAGREATAGGPGPPGLKILLAPSLDAIHRNFVWRVVSFVYFMFSSLWVALRAGPVDLVMGTSPPIFQALTAWLVSRLRRRPFLLEIRDLWPDFAIDMGVLTNPALITLSRRLDAFLRARADHILVNSPAYRDILVARGQRPDQISLIPNGVDPAMFDPAARGEDLRRRLGLSEKFVVTYTGAMGPANDIGTVVRAAELLRDDPSIHLLLVGAGKDLAAQRQLAERLGLDNLSFLGVRPKSEMPGILAASDACLAILADIPMFRTTYPNKVFDYMAAGRPTILAIDGVIRQVVEKSGGGVFVPPGDPQALARAIRDLRRDPQAARRMGQRARRYVAQHFNRDHQAQEFTELITTLAAGGRARRGPGRGARLAKRLTDLGLAALGLVLAAPLMLVLALVIRWRLGSPVIFKQQRPGLHGRLFTLYKFRTMTDARDAAGRLLPDRQRLTRLGRLLRATSLDELPELCNVLRGEMSLVGPRPLLVEYLPLYSPRQARRHQVKPGITGWAQVNGRNALSWEDKFELDIWYVDHWTWWLDMKILLITVVQTLRRQGINQPGQATAEKFTG